MRYDDAAAFRAALAANLRTQHPDKDLSRLLKRTMMERFLARTATALPDQAILKGGYALELRPQQARTTQDLDLSIQDLPDNEVVEGLRDAAEIDLGDHLSFRVETTAARTPQGTPMGGERLTVFPLLGGKRFQPFPSTSGWAPRSPTEPTFLEAVSTYHSQACPPLRPQRSRWRCTSRRSSTPSRFRDPKGASTPASWTSST